MKCSPAVYLVPKEKAEMHALIRRSMCKRFSGGPRFSFARSIWFALAAASCLLAVAGCGSNSASSGLSVGSIAFTDVNGSSQATRKVLTAGESAYMDVNITNDPQLLGAEWSVYCGSAPPPGTPIPPGKTQDDSCGTFIPVHTMSGPIPSYVTSGSGYVTLYTAPAASPKSGTVTLYATATGNRSRVSTVTLIIDPESISIALLSTPPTTLVTGASAQLKAVINNDATSSGVIWSLTCESADCGSLNPTQTASGASTMFTAPAAIPLGGVVQITAASAADPNKSVSFNIAIQAASASAMAGSESMFQ